jgi:hypothetical protein
MKQQLDWPIVRALGKQKYLCAALIIFMLTGPVVGPVATPLSRLVIHLVLILIFITGPLAACRTRGHLLFTAMLGGGLVFTGLSSSVFEQVIPFSILFGSIFFAFLAWLVGRELLQVTTEVDVNTLWMGVNVYILTGLFFAFVYSGVALLDPSAFTGKFMDSPLHDQFYGFVYFSFVTLTTLGYGDLTPGNVIVGTLTYMQALFGQLYVAIMIARLVGLYAAKK